MQSKMRDWPGYSREQAKLGEKFVLGPVEGWGPAEYNRHDWWVGLSGTTNILRVRFSRLLRTAADMHPKGVPVRTSGTEHEVHRCR